MSKRTTTTTTTTTPKASPAPVPPARPATAFQRFEWLRPEVLNRPVNAGPALKLVGRSLDVAQGVGTILQMIEQLQLDEGYQDENGDPLPTTINNCTAGELMRLAISATAMLAEDIWEYQESLNDAIDDGAQQKGGAS